MLRIEVCVDSDEECDIEPGTYKLNSRLTDSIQICEYSSEPAIYQGYFNLKSRFDFERFEYKTYCEENKSEYCIETKLPHKKYKHLWDQIVYEERSKYALFEAIMRLGSADKKTREIFGISKCVLISGEPGTGKTTLSKAIAQKLAIRRSRTYNLKTMRCTQLFSRFYGESMRIIEQALEGGENTIVLVDEADSLLMKRSGLFSKNEPGDSVRIVNTLLSILDSSEALFIFITNFKEELDDAFISRCDVVFEMERLGHEYNYILVRRLLQHTAPRCAFSEFSSIKICKSLADDASLLLFELSAKMADMRPREIKKLIFQMLRSDPEPINILKRIEKSLFEMENKKKKGKITNKL